MGVDRPRACGKTRWRAFQTPAERGTVLEAPMRSRSHFQVAVVDDAAFDEHVCRGPHPERPERLLAAREGLTSVVQDSASVPIPTRHATRNELAWVHTPEYVEKLFRTLSGHGFVDADTYFSPGTLNAALRAAGGAIEFARYLMLGTERTGIALLRPPGHHAEANSAMGFCFLNNIALAASAALQAGARRVATVDWDVHHGNGTQHMFESDPRVLTISLHEWPLYPGTGKASELGVGAGRGSNINVPLPSAASDAEYADAFRRLVLPALDRFGADITLVSAGFDAHERDPLADMRITSEAFGAFASSLIAQADRAGHGRVGFVLEGGYDLRALSESVGSVARAMTGTFVDLPQDKPNSAHKRAVDDVLAEISACWQDLEPYAR